jgi:hypothetical protein
MDRGGLPKNYRAKESEGSAAREEEDLIVAGLY